MLNRVPKYRKKVGRNLAMVRIDGRDHYLGEYDSPESKAEYERLIGEYLVGGRTTNNGRGNVLTVANLSFAYLEHCREYYAESTYRVMRESMKLVRQYLGEMPADEVRGVHYENLQNELAKSAARTYINDITKRLKRMYRWAAQKELVPVDVFDRLRIMSQLAKGRTRARENAAVLPVDDATVEATLTHLRPAMADMVRFQRYTGCRPMEARIVRPMDIDRTGDVWLYRRHEHKSQHLGHERVIPIGPKAQSAIRARLLRADDAFCFSPDKNGKRCYRKNSYGQAIRRACGAAKVSNWCPLQLRHSAATEIRTKFGLEYAQCALGHARADVTQVYAERDQAKAIEVARQLG